MNNKEIISLYKNGLGTCEIAKNKGCNRSTIQRILKSNNIILRKKSPYKNKYDVSFFDTFTDASCYWAGFIAADGCILDRDTVAIHLSEIDISHLQKLAKITKFTGKIEENKKNKSCRISFSGKWYVEALRNNFNIIPRKSLSLKFPEKIPNKLISHFIRGVIDGDGHISKMSRPAIVITSGSKIFLQDMESKIRYFTNITMNNNGNESQITQNNPNVYNLSYFCDNSRKLAEWVYLKSKEETRLDRKYKLFEKMMVLDHPKYYRQRIHHYKLTAPSGKIFYPPVLSTFCRTHSLSAGCLFEVAHGRRKLHKGWKSEFYDLAGINKLPEHCLME